MALNVGSAGFFWWHMPDKVNTFYEQLTDLETDERLGVERTPALRVDWGHHALTRDVLGRVALCLGHLPRADDTEAHQPFNHYLTGLAFMAKTDLTMQFEAPTPSARSEPSKAQAPCTEPGTSAARS